MWVFAIAYNMSIIYVLTLLPFLLPVKSTRSIDSIICTWDIMFWNLNTPCAFNLFAQVSRFLEISQCQFGTLFCSHYNIKLPSKVYALTSYCCSSSSKSIVVSALSRLMREIILYTDFLPSSISFSFKALFEALKSHLYQMHRASFGESQAAKKGWDWWTFFLNKSQNWGGQIKGNLILKTSFTIGAFYPCVLEIKHFTINYLSALMLCIVNEAGDMCKTRQVTSGAVSRQRLSRFVGSLLLAYPAWWCPFWPVASIVLVQHPPLL